MTLEKRTKFFYGMAITKENNYIDIDEGNGQINIPITAGNYYSVSLRAEIELQLNKSLQGEYVVQFDKFTRQMKITADRAFSILIDSGDFAAVGIYRTIGFETVTEYGDINYGDIDAGYGIGDLEGSSVYIGPSTVGKEYRPQFPLQSFTDYDEEQNKRFSKVNESASGVIEEINFGVDEIMQFNIKYITNKIKGCGGMIERDDEGRENAIKFLQSITDHSFIEFYRDRDQSSNFDVLRIISTKSNKKGSGFKLKELYSIGLPNYYETGILRFKRVANVSTE